MGEKELPCVEDFNLRDWVIAAAYTVLAALGGLLGHAMREHDLGRKVQLRSALVESLSSGFIGFLTLLLCRAMSVDPLWSGFIVGIFGWLGARVSIRLLEKIVYNRLGVKLRSDTEKRTNGNGEGH
jgi:hypothetical protein